MEISGDGSVLFTMGSVLACLVTRAPRIGNFVMNKNSNMHVAQDKRFAALIIPVLAFVYLPCITAVYGFSDDFKVFFMDSEGIVSWTYANGRPLLAAIRDLLLEEIDSVTLSWLRAASLVGIVGLALTYYRIIRTIAPPSVMACDEKLASRVW